MQLRERVYEDYTSRPRCAASQISVCDVAANYRRCEHVCSRSEWGVLMLLMTMVVTTVLIAAAVLADKGLRRMRFGPARLALAGLLGAGLPFLPRAITEGRIVSSIGITFTTVFALASGLLWVYTNTRSGHEKSEAFTQWWRRMPGEQVREFDAGPMPVACQRCGGAIRPDTAVCPYCGEVQFTRSPARDR